MGVKDPVFNEDSAWELLRARIHSGETLLASSRGLITSIFRSGRGMFVSFGS